MPVFDTIADLVATVPTPGASAIARGYNAPGDGGGGIFVYSDGGEATDGATAFAYDGDVSAEASDVIALTALNGFDFGNDIAWGSVSLELDTTIPVTLTDVHLHGHAVDTNTTNPLANGQGRLDYKTGVFTDRFNAIRDRATNSGGVNVTVKRKTISNTQRWVRFVQDTDVFHLQWTGAQSGTTDSGHLFNWAFNIAVRDGFQIVDMDGLNVVQSGIVEIPMNMTLRHGKLTTRGSDWAVLELRTTPAYDNSDPEYFVLQMQPWVSGANSTDGTGVFIRLDDIELDGNIAGNQDALLNPGNYDDLENNLQNGVAWSGLSWSNQNGRSMPDNSFCYVNDCYFHDFGSNCATGYYQTYFQTTNLRLKNSARNHLWYGLNGTHTGMHMSGFAWGTYSKSEGCKVTNFAAEELIDNPYFLRANIIWHYEGDDWGDGSLNEPTRFDHRPGALFKNCTIKLPDTGSFDAVFGVLGQSAHFESVCLVTGTNATGAFLGEVGNGFQSGLNRNVTAKDITIILRCGPDFSFLLSRDVLADHLSVENATFHVRRGFTPPDSVTDPQGEFLILNIPDTTLRTDPAFLFQRTASLKEFAYTADYGLGPVRLQDILDLSTEPVRFIIENGIARVIGCLFVTTIGSQGDTGVWTNNNPEKFQGYWKNIFFDCLNFVGSNMRAFLFTASSFENVSMTWTTVVTQQLFSELVIDVDQDFTGQTEIDIPTDLFWVPKRLGSIDLVAKNQAAADALDQAFFSFRDRGNTTDIEWDDLITDGTVDYRAPILRITVATPVPAGNLQLEISLRVV